MEHLRKFVEIFQEKQPQLRAREELFQHLEDTFLPHLLRVIQRDNALMTEVELFPGLKVEWDGTEENWKRFHMALIYSVLHGNPKEKISKVMEAVKGMMPGGSSQADDIQNILENEETQSSMSEMLELIMNTRLVSLVGDIVQSLQFADLDLNFEDPEQVLRLLQNPQDSPALQEIMERAKMILEEKVKSGKINPQELRRDIETIRAKFQSSFGKYLNQAVLGEDAGNTTGNTPQQILSNHPDARRARMLARLQKKQQQKTRDTK
jgi:polyhydroxyalkanoate synthesis regulator phasin